MEDSEVRKKLRILSAITKIHYSIGVNMELEEISRLSVDQIVDIVGCDACTILLIEGDEVKIQAEKSLSEIIQGKELNKDTPAIKHILQTKKSIFTGDILHSHYSDCVPSGCGVNTLICTPVIVDDVVRGIIHLGSRQKEAFDQEDLRFVELLAKEVSIALHRSLLYAQIKAFSTQDSLAGCFNRRKFEEDIEAETFRSERYARPLSLLMIQLDWFKKSSNLHNHQKDDTLLQKLVHLITKNVRRVDKIYRYGREELAILLPEADKEKALVTATRLKNIVTQEEFAGEEQSQLPRKITISLGVASLPQDATTHEKLTKSAESALRRAKELGSNKVYAFTNE